MNFTGWFLLGELLFVSLVILIFITFARWHNRKRLMKELSGLLARVNRSEPDRQARLQARLMESFGLDDDEAESLSIEIIRSERDLFKTFTEIQFGTESRKVGNFDTNVYSLLDNYWRLLGVEAAKERPGSTKTRSPEPEFDLVEDFKVKMEGQAFAARFGASEAASAPDRTGPEQGRVDPEEIDDLAEPSWDDAFAEATQGHESADSADEIGRKGF